MSKAPRAIALKVPPSSSKKEAETNDSLVLMFPEEEGLSVNLNEAWGGHILSFTRSPFFQLTEK